MLSDVSASTLIIFLPYVSESFLSFRFSFSLLSYSLSLWHPLLCLTLSCSFYFQYFVSLISIFTLTFLVIFFFITFSSFLYPFVLVSFFLILFSLWHQLLCWTDSFSLSLFVSLVSTSTSKFQVILFFYISKFLYLSLSFPFIIPFSLWHRLLFLSLSFSSYFSHFVSLTSTYKLLLPVIVSLRFQLFSILLL